MSLDGAVRTFSDFCVATIWAAGAEKIVTCQVGTAPVPDPRRRRRLYCQQRDLRSALRSDCVPALVSGDRVAVATWLCGVSAAFVCSRYPWVREGERARGFFSMNAHVALSCRVLSLDRPG